MDRVRSVEAKEFAFVWVKEKAPFTGFMLEGVEQTV